MGAGETLDQYADSILKESRQLQLPDSKILQIFIQVLQSEIKQFVPLSQPGYNVTSLTIDQAQIYGGR